MDEPRFSPFVRADEPPDPRRPRIVVVGGGAGGLELAARLGESLGRHGRAEIVLVDPLMTHMWKPLLHEVAAGTLDPGEGAVDYLQQARRHGFRFHLGTLEGIDRARREIQLTPLADDEGNEIAPLRRLRYDRLVIAVGSTDNDFGIPGVRAHALSLNGVADAERFHRRLLALCARAELQDAGPLRIVIVGGGATGVELAAELSESIAAIASYGNRLNALAAPARLTIVEHAPRLLAALPEAVARHAQADLERRGIDLMLQRRVVELGPDHVIVADGERRESLRADLTVWAAGIRAPEFLTRLDGLETNALHQLVVRPTLQTTRDDAVYAIGDCASCVLEPGGRPVPPKAQAAHQQAQQLARSFALQLSGAAPAAFRYRDRGTLVSLGTQDAVGELAPEAGRRGWIVEGLLARLSYWSLYRQHLAALMGVTRTAIITLGGWLAGRGRPRVKLH